MSVTPPLSLTKDNGYKGRIVYGWKRDGIYLYIGMSNNGTRRAFHNHNVIRLIDGDVIDVWITSDPIYLEMDLINHYKPKFNKPVKSHIPLYTVTETPRLATKTCPKCKVLFVTDKKHDICYGCFRAGDRPRFIRSKAYKAYLRNEVFK